MSRPVDPDDPTRRLPAEELPPRRLPPEEPRMYEREVVADDYVWREEIIDRLNSLRTAVVLLGVLAVAALGVALYALLTQEDDQNDGRRGATADDVRDLDQRVDNLEQQLDDVPSRDAVSQVSDNVKSLDDRVKALEDESGDSGATQQAIEDLQGDIQQLSDSVQQLDERVQSLEEQQTP